MAVTIGASGVTFNDSTIQTSGWTTTIFGGYVSPSTGVTANFPLAWRRLELITSGPYSGGSPVNVSTMNFYDTSGQYAGGSIRLMKGLNSTSAVNSNPATNRTYSGSVGEMQATINGTDRGWYSSQWVLQKIPNSSSIHIMGTAHSDVFSSVYTGWYTGQGPLTSCKYAFTKTGSEYMYITMRAFN